MTDPVDMLPSSDHAISVTFVDSEIWLVLLGDDGPHDLFAVEQEKQGMFDLVGIGLDELVNSQ